jgi:hypothetical protein
VWGGERRLRRTGRWREEEEEAEEEAEVGVVRAGPLRAEAAEKESREREEAAEVKGKSGTGEA